MRIALVHPKFGSFGGAERYAMSLAQGLCGCGHDVHLFGRKFKNVSNKIPFHRVPTLKLGRGVKTWSFARISSLLVNQHAFDIIQGFGKTLGQNVHRTGGGVHRAYLERLGKSKISLYDRIVIRIEDTLFSLPSLKAIICPSQWVVEELQQFYPKVSEKLHLIPNGVDTKIFHTENREFDRKKLVNQLGIPVSYKIFLFVASNFYLKGLDIALEVLAQMPQTALIVAGGDESRPYQSRARELGAADRLFFVGQQEKTAPFYRAADVFFHPTRYDPFANVCLEALSCGTPILTTERNGVADLIENRIGGRVVPVSADRAVMVQALQDLGDQGDAQRMAARKIALQHDRSVHVSNVIALYQHVLG